MNAPRRSPRQPPCWGAHYPLGRSKRYLRLRSVSSQLVEAEMSGPQAERLPPRKGVREMQVKIVLNVREMSKEDIRGFVQMIRDWELRTPKAEVVGVLFETDPEITVAEVKEIFEGIFPEFDHLVGVPESKPGLLRLGRRGLVADGDLIGTCDELTLTI
ncbi:hypothetical protein LCGC14_2819040, partial [marine sediment metagenome]